VDAEPSRCILAAAGPVAVREVSALCHAARMQPCELANGGAVEPMDLDGAFQRNRIRHVAAVRG
jgi:hypothetical protein